MLAGQAALDAVGMPLSIPSCPHRPLEKGPTRALPPGTGAAGGSYTQPDPHAPSPLKGTGSKHLRKAPGLWSRVGSYRRGKQGELAHLHAGVRGSFHTLCTGAHCSSHLPLFYLGSQAFLGGKKENKRGSSTSHHPPKLPHSSTTCTICSALLVTEGKASFSVFNATITLHQLQEDRCHRGTQGTGGQSLQSTRSTKGEKGVRAVTQGMKIA